jgi:hypothetical protein
MPAYTMKNNNTGEEQEMFLSLAEREELLSSGEWTQQLATAQFVTQVGGTLKRAGSGWKDVLGKIKSGSGRNNTIHD